jgi:hypothetical protein
MTAMTSCVRLMRQALVLLRRASRENEDLLGQMPAGSGPVHQFTGDGVRGVGTEINDIGAHSRVVAVQMKFACSAASRPKSTKRRARLGFAFGKNNGGDRRGGHRRCS